MSRSSFSKAYKEIANLNPMEMTFTIEDADLDKLHEVLKDINVKECPWFEVQDKHGNKAKYYREPHWIPCSEKMPNDVEIGEEYPMVIFCTMNETYYGFLEYTEHGRTWWSGDAEYQVDEVVAWMPLPEPY